MQLGKTRSYNETKNSIDPNFKVSYMDWFQVLRNLINGAEVSVNLAWDLSERSENWVTCACGNQCDIIPRNMNGEPEDKKLYQLGIRFSDAIATGCWKEVYDILGRIEVRSHYLILQELKKQKKS